MKKFLAKLINWEAPKGAHKPSAEEVFHREQARDKELAGEREEQHKQNKQGEGWEQVRLPKGTEQNPK